LLCFCFPDSQPKQPEGGARKKREKKVFLIDFVGGEAIDPKKLFAKGTPATLNLPKERKTSSLLVLPVDVHFSSKELTKLFTKPMWAVSAACSSSCERNS